MANTESVSHDDLVVCGCGGQEHTARDAIHAALYRGDLEPLWRPFLRRVAAEKHADETEMELDDDAIDSAAEQFRYQYDLITAEETEQWLVMRGLTLDDFSSYFARRYCDSVLEDKVKAEDTDYVSAPDDLRQLFAADLIMTGDLEHMTTSLTWRLASAAAVEKEGVPEKETAAEKARFFERSGLSEKELPAWLEKIGRDSAWFDQMVRREAAYLTRSESLITPQSRQREVSQLRLQLTRYETEVLELESKDAAQEALFCVRQDGMTMEEVATEGRYPYRSISFLQEDLPDELQQKFLSVLTGDVMEPLARGDGFELYRIVKKVEPQADDPEVQERVEKLIVHRHFAELSARHVEPRLHAATSPE